MKFARYWLPAVLWTCVVLAASTDAFSSQNTGSILARVATALFGHINPATFELVHFLIRKAAHLTEYGILGLLWFRAWRGVRVGWYWKWGLFGVAIVLVVASADEIHQTFVPSRTGEFSDVVLDLFGALIAQFLLWLVIRRRGARVAGAAPEGA